MLEGMEAGIYSFLFILNKMTNSLITLELGGTTAYSIFPFAVYFGLLEINRMISPRRLLFFAAVFAACPFIYRYSTTQNYMEEIFHRSIMDNMAIQASMSATLLFSGLLALPIIFFPRKFPNCYRGILQISHLATGTLLLISGTMLIAGSYPFFGFAKLSTHPWQWAGQQTALYVFLTALTVIIPAAIGAMPRNGPWRYYFSTAGLGYVGAAIFLGYNLGAFAFANLAALFAQ